jgi:RNA polymerase sigma factor (sigma-70 family)
MVLPTVFVVDDDAALRESLRWLIESVGLRVATYDSAQSFLAEYDPARPGCLVLDIRMPGQSGLELQEKLRERGSDIPIIVITAYAEVPMAVRAFKAGAVDFIEKPFSDQVLLDRIQQAVEKDRQRRHEMEKREKLLVRVDRLTPREREVLQLIVAGKPSKVIAADLGVSQKTIEVHRSRIMAKMEANSLASLVRIAVQSGAARAAD